MTWWCKTLVIIGQSSVFARDILRMHQYLRNWSQGWILLIKITLLGRVTLILISVAFRSSSTYYYQYQRNISLRKYCRNVSSVYMHNANIQYLYSALYMKQLNVVAWGFDDKYTVICLWLSILSKMMKYFFE